MENCSGDHDELARQADLTKEPQECPLCHVIYEPTEEKELVDGKPVKVVYQIKPAGLTRPSAILAAGAVTATGRRPLAPELQNFEKNFPTPKPVRPEHSRHVGEREKRRRLKQLASLENKK